MERQDARVYAARAMGGGLEREFKLQLPDEAALARLRAEFAGAPSATARQVNHFFDSRAGTLRAARLALRLRDEDGRFALTLKGPRQGGGSVSVRAEEELALAPEQAARILAGERCPLAALELGGLAASTLVQAARRTLGAGNLVRLGAFENERTRLGPLQLAADVPALTLELDRTRFPDGLACELELELPPHVAPAPIEAALRALFTRLGYAWRPAGNKAARFFAALEAPRPPAD